MSHRAWTSSRRRLTAVLGLAGISVAAGATAGIAAPSEPATPDDLPAPTDQQLRKSVLQWEPNSVRQWDTEGSVTPLATDDEDGGDSVITLASDVLFEFDSAKIPQNAAEAVVQTLEQVPDGTEVKIFGYTDSIGSSSANKKLSQKRAQAVADIIEDKRPDLELTVEGYGESDPVAENTVDGEDNPEGRAKNRRVEIRYADN